MPHETIYVMIILVLKILLKRIHIYLTYLSLCSCVTTMWKHITNPIMNVKLNISQEAPEIRRSVLFEFQFNNNIIKLSLSSLIETYFCVFFSNPDH